MKTLLQKASAVAAIGFYCTVGWAQKSSASRDWQRLLRMPAVSGYEQPLGEEIRKRLRDVSPKTDSLGNLYVTVGSGAPHRLIVAPIDEPGYVISDITDDGYLRVQRLPQRTPNDVFDALNFAQPATVDTRGGQHISAAFAGLSVQLETERQDIPTMVHPNELFVDIGAKSAEEVRKTGVDVLDPLAIARHWFAIGNSGEAGPAIGDRFGAYALVQILGDIKGSKAQGTTTIAFLTQEWTGARGLSRILTEIHPDDLILVGRMTIDASTSERTSFSEPTPGTGVVIGKSANTYGVDRSLAAEIQAIAEKEHVPIRLVVSEMPQITDENGASIPKRFIRLGVPTLWPVTPAEFVAWNDVAQLQKLLEAYLDIPRAAEGSKTDLAPARRVRRAEDLVGTYGASGHEETVREVIVDLLDLRIRNMVQTDAAGNLALHLGGGKRSETTPRIVFVAHMDEIGYEVKRIEDDGRLEVEMLGRGYPQYFWGHVVFVHKKDGRRVGGVLELPKGWDKSTFKWPTGLRPMDEPARVFLGTRTKQETEQLGIAAGDFVTIPKEYRRLTGTRVSAASLDDRVGCAALIAAANAIGPDLFGRDVTFIWSSEGELGSKGAAAFAAQAAAEARVPDVVFAVDAFASSDSPLESKRFADAELGKGFVVRAIDNSSVVPRQYVDRVLALAKENEIPAQFGITGGENDGAVFLRYGSVNVVLGWPLRYSHSPAEVIDTQDFDALGKIVEVLARKW